MPRAHLRDKVVVAMSGGVDSSVAACLLQEQGYDVVGMFMRVGRHDNGSPAGASRKQGCCSASDAADARFVAGVLGIPFYALNFEDDFGKIIDYFADEYARGRTPNPCVVCNHQLKFGKIAEYADLVGAKYIATGHYARVGRPDLDWMACDNGDRSGPRCDSGMAGRAIRQSLRNGRHDEDASSGSHMLFRARDERKDQSYVLFGLSRDLLDRVMFPLGGFTKEEVRAIAAQRGFPNSEKPDSVEICFVPDDNYARVVQRRRPDAFASGKVVDRNGVEVGAHAGIGHYTIGQRRGLGIAAGTPIYVTGLNAETRTVTIGERGDLSHRGLIASRANLLVDFPTGPIRVQAKIRYLHRPAAATLHRRGNDGVMIEFDQPQRAITPGQAVVFYQADLVLGGAWIDQAVDPA